MLLLSTPRVESVETARREFVFRSLFVLLEENKQLLLYIHTQTFVLLYRSSVSQKAFFGGGGRNEMSEHQPINGVGCVAKRAKKSVLDDRQTTPSVKIGSSGSVNPTGRDRQVPHG